MPKGHVLRRKVCGQWFLAGGAAIVQGNLAGHDMIRQRDLESPADTGNLLNDKIRTYTYNKDKNVRKTRKECGPFLLFFVKIRGNDRETLEKILRQWYNILVAGLMAGWRFGDEFHHNDAAGEGSQMVLW